MVDRTTRMQSEPDPVVGPGLCLRVVVAATLAGALAGGGGIIAAIGFFRPDVTYMLLGLVPPLFVLGALFGFLHGAVLAWLGRPRQLPRGVYRRQLLGGFLWSFPGLVLAAVITFWVAYTTALLSAGRPGWIFSVILGWIAAAVTLFWAAAECLRAFRNAFARWPGWRLGLTLIAGTFVSLFFLLPRWRFELRGADLEFSTLGCALVALLLTIWVAAPIEVLLLRRFRPHRTADRSGFRELEVAPNRPSLREAK